MRKGAAARRPVAEARRGLLPAQAAKRCRATWPLSCDKTHEAPKPLRRSRSSHGNTGSKFSKPAEKTMRVSPLIASSNESTLPKQHLRRANAVRAESKCRPAKSQARWPKGTGGFAPVVSGHPNCRFMFCTATAPFLPIFYPFFPIFRPFSPSGRQESREHGQKSRGKWEKIDKNRGK